MSQTAAFEAWRQDLVDKVDKLLFQLNQEVRYNTKRQAYQWLSNLEPSQQKLIQMALYGTSGYYNYYHYFDPGGRKSREYNEYLLPAAREVVNAFFSATYHSSYLPKPFPKEWDYPGSWSQDRISKQKQLDEAKEKIAQQLTQVRSKKEALLRQLEAFKRDIGIT